MYKTTLTAVHVDDDPVCLELFRIAVAPIANLQLAASFDNAAAALTYLNKTAVDLLFLDVDMPDKNGLWLAEQLGNEKTGIVFVTGFAQYALAAFEACALDYVIKPVTTKLLQQTLERCRNKWTGPDLNNGKSGYMPDQLQEFFDNYLLSNSSPRRIFVSLKGYLQIINVENIIYIESVGATTRFHLQNGETVDSGRVMKYYGRALEQHPDFVRIHRAYIVNKNYVSFINRDNELYSVKMSNGALLDLSKRRKNEILESILQ